MAAVKTKLGRIPCDCCGHPVVLKENEAGTLTVSCDECDVSAFAKKGTAAATKWRAKLPAQAPESVPKAPAPAPAAPAPVEQPKAPKKPATPFDPLGFLNKGKAA
ncbi:hypothetical protein [Massilia sp. DD77]|uniref:hypothetical protein n=1 Tax=Massilia sp. DD77 TaxID=3109349 RepID=UPI00300035F3